MPVSAGYRESWAPFSYSNQVKGACPLWGQVFICKIKPGDKTMRNLRSRIVVSEQWLVVSCVSCLLVLAVAKI